MKTRHLSILGALLLAGCASHAGSEDKIPVVQVEPLYAVRVALDVVTIRVNSTGCTTKDSFVALAGPSSRRSHTLTFARSKPDLCEAVASPIELSWTFAELDLPKGADVVVDNPQLPFR